jgi:hypothetical protein
VTGKDFRHRTDGILERQGAIVCMRVYLHCKKHRKAESHTVAAEYGAIAFDDAIALQALHTAEARGGRQADPVGKLDIAQPGVGLELRNNAPINGIELDFWHV